MSRNIIELDKKIITLLYDNQSISQEEIAKKVRLSQPSVAMRIKKLKEKGVVENIIGVNINKVGIYLYGDGKNH